MLGGFMLRQQIAGSGVMHAVNGLRPACQCSTTNLS
jgi:hypothetical protein